MALDSTAELLFRINAESQDAEGNIARFRTLMGKDLDDLGAEFDDWSKRVLGDLTTVQGVMIASGAAIAAGLVAAAAGAKHAADEYVNFVSEISSGSKMTGIAVEEMSALHFAATETGVSYDSLVRGITKFEAAVVKANESEEGRVKMARLLGVSQAQVAAGEKNILPLLEASADRFKNLAAGTERAAVARELFGRGGVELLSLLSQGSEGFKRFAEEAKKLGLVLGKDDVEAMKEFKAAANALRAEQEALDVEIGRRTLPLFTAVKTVWAALVQTVAEGHVGTGQNSFLLWWRHNMDEMEERVKKLASGLASQGAGKDLLDNLPPKVAKVRQEFSGLSDILETVSQRINSSIGGQSHVDEEIQHLQYEVAKATEKFNELKKAGELSPKAVKEGMAELAQLPLAIQSLSEELTEKLHERQKEEYDRFADDLRQRIAAHQAKTLANEQAAWQDEIAKLRDHLAQMKGLATGQAQQLNALLAELSKAGAEKITRERSEALAAAGDDLEKRLLAARDKGYRNELQAWALEMEGLRRHLTEKSLLTADNVAKLAQLDAAGRDKIARAQRSEYELEMTNLRSHLARIVETEMTHEQKLAAEYQRDVAAYGRAQMEKAILAAGGEAHRAEVEAEFATIRTALLNKYQTDLQALRNSQGWQGVFGNQFGSLLRNNEQAYREWANSTSQATEMVKFSMTALDEIGKQTFEHLAQGMGSGIASAIVYSKSIGEAMRAAAASTLEQVASECLTQAIYATGLGFLRLAEHDYAGAESAFTSAAIFGAVGVGSAIVGRAIAPQQGQAAGAGTARGAAMAPGTGGVSMESGGGSGSYGQRQPHVTVNVYGHVVGTSGVAELTSMINDAVLNQDVTLTASNTTTGVQIRR